MEAHEAAEEIKEAREDYLLLLPLLLPSVLCRCLSLDLSVQAQCARVTDNSPRRFILNDLFLAYRVNMQSIGDCTMMAIKPEQ